VLTGVLLGLCGLCQAVKSDVSYFPGRP